MLQCNRIREFLDDVGDVVERVVKVVGGRGVAVPEPRIVGSQLNGMSLSAFER